MSWLRTLKELINPDSVSHPSVPPFEAGLRPNSLLDAGRSILGDSSGSFEPDDVAFLADGALVFTSGSSLYRVADGETFEIANLDGSAGAIAATDEGAIVAVRGIGLVSVCANGAVRLLCGDPLVAGSVTDLTVVPGGDLLVTVGCESGASWARALVSGEATGKVVRVSGDRATVVASRLPWPSGISLARGEVLLSLSLAHRIERRPLDDLAAQGVNAVGTLPVYPGRIRQVDDGWWVAAPYARNRMTELILDEPELSREMVETILEEQWMVPRLRSDNPFTDVAQHGQVRVHGEIKPWAPPRSYGLVFKIDRTGRIARGAHSRADGDRHGVTGVAARGDVVVAAAQGARDLIAITIEGAKS